MHCTVIRHRVLISCTEINSHTTGWKYRQYSTAFMRSKIKGALNEKSMPYKAELIRGKNRQGDPVVKKGLAGSYGQ